MTTSNNKTSSTSKNSGIFYHHGLASLAKSLIYYGLAKTSQSQQEFIPAVITGYYSLFHLTLALMYFCPQNLQQKTRADLEAEIRKNNDPTDKISHSAALKFLEEMKQKGLPEKNFDLLKLGKTLREYVNYAPRIKRNGEGAFFETCQFGINDFSGFITNCDDFFTESLKWALATPPDPKDHYLKIALQQAGDFLTQPDLGYSQWLTETSKNHAMNKLKDLQLLLQTQV